MTDLKRKYPFLFFETVADEESLTPEDRAARLRDLWEREEALRSSARSYVKNIDVFSTSRFHDSKIFSAQFEGDCLTLCVNDSIFNVCFEAVNSLLGLGVPDELIECPVTIRIERVRNLHAFQLSYEDPENSDLTPLEAALASVLTMAEVPITEVLPVLNEYLYEEIALITGQSISIGFSLETKNRDGILLDIDAGSLTFVESLRSIFYSLFGEQNADIFDAFWRARNDRKLGWDCIDPAIRIIRALRPELPEDLDQNDYYVKHELELNAEEAVKNDNLQKAAEIYQRLILNEYDFGLCKKLGKCLFQIERYNEALLYLYAAAGKNSKDLDVRIHLVQACYELERPIDAASELKHCLAADPNFGPALKFIEMHPEIREYMDLYGE